MSLENGILGYLSMKPMSGYDIKKLFDMSAAYFWPADQAQIYRTLKKLNAGGMIEVSGVEQDSGPSKTLYAITKRGREEMRSWLLNPELSDFVARLPFLVQLFFSGALNREELLKFIDTQVELNNCLHKMLSENFIENGNAFAETAGLSKDDPRYLSAVWAYRWGVLSCETYTKLLTEIKAEIPAGTDSKNLDLTRDYKEDSK
jgi:DNA-binding PadR family transcriptional regulator